LCSSPNLHLYLVTNKLAFFKATKKDNDWNAQKWAAILAETKTLLFSELNWW